MEAVQSPLRCEWVQKRPHLGSRVTAETLLVSEELERESEVKADVPVSNILDIFRPGSDLESEGPAAVQVACREHGCPGPSGGLEEVGEGLWCSESLDLPSKGPSNSWF